MCHRYHFSTRGIRIDTAGKPSDTIASHFVRLLQNNGTEVCIMSFPFVLLLPPLLIFVILIVMFVLIAISRVCEGH
jgi:hypothetical protein